MGFKFELGQKVEAPLRQRFGVIVGRAEYVQAPVPVMDQYLIDFGDRLEMRNPFPTDWLSEDELRPVAS